MWFHQRLVTKLTNSRQGHLPERYQWLWCFFKSRISHAGWKKANKKITSCIQRHFNKIYTSLEAPDRAFSPLPISSFWLNTEIQAKYNLTRTSGMWGGWPSLPDGFSAVPSALLVSVLRLFSLTWEGFVSHAAGSSEMSNQTQVTLPTPWRLCWFLLQVWAAFLITGTSQTHGSASGSVIIT